MEIEKVKNKIHTIRDKQVILDSDLAELYGVETKALNQAVRRNKEKFPEDFCFQLNKEENKYLWSQIVTLEKSTHKGKGKHKKYLPYVFTEQGIAMLSSVLKSKKATQVNIEIMRAFIQMRHFLKENLQLLNKINHIETKQIKLEIETNNQFKELFDKFETKNITKKEGIFFQGEVFPAYLFISSLIRSAEKEIILIDNYIDETTLDLLSKSKTKITIITKNYNKTDIKKFSKEITIKQNKSFHDMLNNQRFLASYEFSIHRDF